MGRRTRTSVSEMPLRRKYESALSIDRFSEHSLHAEYIDYEKSNMCNDCMSRIPYATLIATIMCCLGVGLFCFTMNTASATVDRTLKDIFYAHPTWLEPVKLTFAIIAASMAALGLMILCVGFLATGATRTKVYRAWRTRVGGRISCAVFMTITYILQIFWLLVFAFLVIVTMVYTVFWGLCAQPAFVNNSQCIDLTQFRFLFPSETRDEDMKICGENENRIFCKEGVNVVYIYFVFGTISAFLVVLSLVHYLMCLSANYAHIRDHEKFQELQDMQYLQPNDPDSPQPGMGTLGSHHRGKF